MSGPRYLITAEDAVDLEGRSRPAFFECGVAFFARERRHAEKTGVGALVEWQTTEFFRSHFSKGQQIIIEARSTMWLFASTQADSKRASVTAGFATLPPNTPE